MILVSYVNVLKKLPVFVLQLLEILTNNGLQRTLLGQLYLGDMTPTNMWGVISRFCRFCQTQPQTQSIQ
jgi:hypothetical protein